MIYSTTIGIPHDSAKAKPSVITGPEVSVDEQIQAFKKLCAVRTHPEFKTVIVLGSNSGAIRQQSFRPEAKTDSKPEKAKK